MPCRQAFPRSSRPSRLQRNRSHLCSSNATTLVQQPPLQLHLLLCSFGLSFRLSSSRSSSLQIALHLFIMPVTTRSRLQLASPPGQRVLLKGVGETSVDCRSSCFPPSASHSDPTPTANPPSPPRSVRPSLGCTIVLPPPIAVRPLSPPRSSTLRWIAAFSSRTTYTHYLTSIMNARDT